MASTRSKSSDTSDKSKSSKSSSSKSSASGRAKASEKVGKAMHERKHGELKSGSSGKKVTSRKQAIAIGLSEARRAGAKVPPRKPSHS
jgi:hypothetical protein